MAALGGARAQDLQATEHTVDAGGIARSYLLHLPDRVSSPAPLVLVFHGGGGRPQGIMRTSGMNAIADREHFVVAYPAGTGRAFGGGGSWNIGTPDSPSASDDVGFVAYLLRDIERQIAIDPRRIYATGESMGGVFSYRLACEMSDTFAAIAPVAATLAEADCQPHSPVAVLHIHGTADELIPFNGGQGSLLHGRTWPAPSRGVSLWTQFDGCSGAPGTLADGPETTCHVSTGCKATVEFCVVNGGGHAWPGSAPLQWQQRYKVYVAQSFPASERIWAFFAANPKK